HMTARRLPSCILPLRHTMLPPPRARSAAYVRHVRREDDGPAAQPPDHSAVQVKIRRPRESADLQIRRHARAHDFAAQLERRLALVDEREPSLELCREVVRARVTPDLKVCALAGSPYLHLHRRVVGRLRGGAVVLASHVAHVRRRAGARGG
ncbi:hypothetical protein CF640_36870, partial [Burkholderia pseudomallei]